MRTQLVTIHDVARAAGVSPATVSRVFNGGKVTPARALSVQEAAAALGFAPNRVARSLRKQRSSVIALIIPDIENPIFTSLARGVEDAAQRTSLSVVLCNSDEDTDKERRYLEVALGEQMAGVIVAAASQDETDLGPLTDRRVPVVAVDRRPRDAEVDAVRVDNHHGGEVATRHLLQAGYHRIACVTGPEGVSTSEERLAGHRTALRAAQGGPAAADDTYVRHADFRVDGGRAAMRELLALPEPPDAVFVGNSLMTIGVLDALRETGRTPPDVGVLSFGDVPWASLVRPSLTAVELPSYELGRTAADLLLQRMDGSVSPVQTVVLRTKLQVRESTAGPARA
ncbi:LacI family DNA-binding transcriptional regulator [Streptomyces rhizosphaericus]|uniref:LacI family DNA-binding transcriptional regulator n=1 Tax=Streptomyces rhizosphaericus TaxID=114699 RepID=UPI001FCA4684|nr:MULTISPECIES: LacI family DNA-binding transcriptional regulator [Streptomyces violaceusniger group]